MKDIYLEEDYCKINTQIDKGIASHYEYDGVEGNITYNFIKRRIYQEFDAYNDYYDITSPYGYGGPVINKCNNYNLLIEKFYNDFANYCNDNNIISEFVRFHPLINNHLDFNFLYDINFSRKTVGTNLSDFENPFQEEFSKSCKKKIRKLLKEGLNYKVIERPEELTKFTEFYYSTMDRNKADNFYYFSQSYFDEFLKYYKDNIILVETNFEETTIAMGFYFIYEDYIHIHLSGTLSEYLYKSPAYILRYGVTMWGKENGYKMIHHGGGRTSDLEDGLYKFKKQFGKNTSFNFYLGKKIWNKDIYLKLCDFYDVDSQSEFFPAYRGNIKKDEGNEK